LPQKRTSIFTCPFWFIFYQAVIFLERSTNLLPLAISFRVSEGVPPKVLSGLSTASSSIRFLASKCASTLAPSHFVSLISFITKLILSTKLSLYAPVYLFLQTLLFLLELTFLPSYSYYLLFYLVVYIPLSFLPLEISPILFQLTFLTYNILLKII